MTRSYLLSAVLLLAAACGDGGRAEQATPTRPIRISSPFVEQLKALNDRDRNLALMRAIQDGGNRCKRVDRSAYQQDFKNLSMWVGECADKRTWAVFIAPTGDVQVRACAEAGQLGLPGCRTVAGDPAEAKS